MQSSIIETTMSNQTMIPFGFKNRVNPNMTARPDMLLNPHMSSAEQSGMLTMRHQT